MFKNFLNKNKQNLIWLNKSFLPLTIMLHTTYNSYFWGHFLFTILSCFVLLGGDSIHSVFEYFHIIHDVPVYTFFILFTLCTHFYIIAIRLISLDFKTVFKEELAAFRKLFLLRAAMVILLLNPIFTSLFPGWSLWSIYRDQASLAEWSILSYEIQFIILVICCAYEARRFSHRINMINTNGPTAHLEVFLFWVGQNIYIIVMAVLITYIFLGGSLTTFEYYFTDDIFLYYYVFFSDKMTVVFFLISGLSYELLREDAYVLYSNEKSLIFKYSIITIFGYYFLGSL
jgi:hypothetical protein